MDPITESAKALYKFQGAMPWLEWEDLSDEYQEQLRIAARVIVFTYLSNGGC